MVISMCFIGSFIVMSTKILQNSVISDLEGLLDMKVDLRSF